MDDKQQHKNMHQKPNSLKSCFTESPKWPLHVWLLKSESDNFPFNVCPLMHDLVDQSWKVSQ